MNRTLICMFALAATGLLAGCGKMGDLERPAPRGLSDTERAMHSAQRPGPANETNRPARAGSVEENVDPARSEATIRQVRLPGSAPDPFGGPAAAGFPSSGPR